MTCIRQQSGIQVCLSAACPRMKRSALHTGVNDKDNGKADQHSKNNSSNLLGHDFSPC
jgi:hypothetical protein